MKAQLFSIVLLLTCSTLVAQTMWSDKLTEKVEHAASLAYGSESISYIPIYLDESCTSDDHARFDNKLYSVQAGDSLVGYMYVDQAPSMKNVFDYVVFFNPDFTIKKSKVLIYREQHGRQIGSVRWLSQFNRMDMNDRPKLGEDIDGISGATISCTNMTNSVSALLEHIFEAYDDCLR